MRVTPAMEAGDKSSHNTDGPSFNLPYWLRLTRNGDFFTGEVSADEKNWRRVDSIAVPMSKTLHVGLALSAHNNSALNSSLFDNVTVTPVPTPVANAR